MQDQNPEFQNLLRLLESTDPAQVQLGLQIAQNYQTDFEAYFGMSLQKYNELVDVTVFLLEHEEWKNVVGYNVRNFAEAISDIQHLSVRVKQIKSLCLSEKNIESLPSFIYFRN
ncbi:MAG: hypothetical protein EAZ95_02590 [Bacteroidetes bacterium]|nr:MAG: hypothetical protein EAZ95_02590 [Bacteroidota bacterium]